MAQPCRFLYLIRHGLVEPRYRGRYIGASDVALSPEGEAQMDVFAKHHGRLLSRVGLVYVSPLSRCRASAARLFASSHATEVCSEALREIDFGAWEGLSADEISAKDSAAWQNWLSQPLDFAFPGGESRQAFHARVARFCGETLPAMPDHSAIVAHAGVIQHIVLHVAGIPAMHQFALCCAPSSLSVMRLYAGDKGVILHLNDLSHQPEEDKEHG